MLGLFLLSVLANKPPGPVVQQLSCTVTIRDASVYGPVYQAGLQYTDAPAGKVRKVFTDYTDPKQNTTSDYLRHCPNASWYVEPGTDGKPSGACTENLPLPGQCEGLPPIMEPAAIPSDASFQGTLKINGVTASQWDYLDDGLQQVVSAYVYDSPDNSGKSVLVRFVAARVQTDYTDIVLGAPPASAFTPQKQCPPSPSPLI
eukprot:gene18081-17898_t